MAWNSSSSLGTVYGDIPHASGRFYDSRLQSSFTTVALVANTLYAQPFYVPRSTTYATIGIEVTTLAVGKSVRLGIYNDNGGVPGSRVVDCGTVSTTTTGAKPITINQVLAAGWYWLAAVSDGTATLRAAVQAGSLPSLGFTSGTDTTFHNGWSVAFTYAALPDPFTAGGALMTTAMYRILLGV